MFTTMLELVAISIQNIEDKRECQLWYWNSYLELLQGFRLPDNILLMMAELATFHRYYKQTVKWQLQLQW